MYIRNIVKTAALELGMYEDILAYEKGENPAFASEAETLLACFNLVENELALDYLPLWAEESFQTNTGTIFYKQFSKKITRVVKVSDKWGNEIPFRIFPEYVAMQAEEVNIRYAYAPEKKGLGDKTDFQLRVSERLFAYGIAAEYSLLKGNFEEAAAWDAKYKEAIASAYRSGKSVRISSRRWV